jgi:tetratricopeptide (TPR) repeat protein
MKAAQDAMKAKKWQDTLTKLREVESTPGPKSQFDQYMISEFRTYAYHNLRQDAEAAREMEATLNSPCLTGEKKADRLKNLVGLYTQMRNYPKAIEHGNAALKISRDPDLQVFVAQAYYQSGNNKESARIMNELMTSLERSGQKPKEQQLLLVQSACEKAKDNACVAKVFEKLVLNYPKPDYWSNLMVALRHGDNNDVQTLNVMRLSAHVKVMKKSEEFKEMAQLAIDENLGAEAQTVLEEAFAKNLFTDPRDVSVNQRLLALAKSRAAAEKAALPKSEADAKAAATGDRDVLVGAQYLAFGDAAKAVEALQRGITKGGIGKGTLYEAQKADEAAILLGIAQLKSNNKAEAKKAFNSVKRDPTMVRIAKLWALNAS